MSVIKFLDLGSQPIANGFLTKEEFDKLMKEYNS